jgi:hypothetical protein
MPVTRIDLQEFETANRYLTGRLSEAECVELEKRLTREPELLRELEAVARFKVGLQVLHERGELEAATRGPHWSYRWLAMAAAIAVLAIGALMFRSFVTPDERSMLAAVPAALTDRQGNVLPSAGTFTLLRKRVTTADAVIELPPPGRAIQIRVLPESPAQADGYSVSLWQQAPAADPRKLGSLSHLTPAADGFLVIFLDTTPLAPGEYLLVVSPTAAEDRPDGGDVFRISMSPAARN